MKEIRLRVLCKKSGKPLYFPELVYLDKRGGMVYVDPPEASGIFVLEIPDYVKEIAVRHKDYKTSPFYKVNPGMIIKLDKYSRNEENVHPLKPDLNAMTAKLIHYSWQNPLLNRKIQKLIDQLESYLDQDYELKKDKSI